MGKQTNFICRLGLILRSFFAVVSIANKYKKAVKGLQESSNEFLKLNAITTPEQRAGWIQLEMDAQEARRALYLATGNERKALLKQLEIYDIAESDSGLRAHRTNLLR